MAQRILVAGALAVHPIGGSGNTWAFLQYLLGFRRLGCEVIYVEHIDGKNCIGDDWQPSSFADSANVRHFRATMERWGFLESSSFFELDGTGSCGLTRSEVLALAGDADLLINMSGRFHAKEILTAARRRLYLDLDPGYVQIWQEKYGVDMNLRGHDVYATVGLNLGAADCPMPTCGVHWEHTLPPVVLDEWRDSGVAGRHYTTVADWRGYGPVEWDGVWYGQKADEFRKIMTLPRQVVAPLEICLAIHPDEPDRRALVENGWILSDPLHHSATTDTYRAFISGSRGEFTVVKNGYAAGKTGWVSDRSVCYLAAGRPVIVQDTGIGRYLPTGSGLLTFTDVSSAAAAIDAVEADYERHAAAARAFAAAYLDSDIVLSRLLEVSGL